MPSNRKGRAIQVYMPDELAAQLQALADELGRTVSTEIVHAVRRHLAARPVLVVPEMTSVNTSPGEGQKRGRPKKTREAREAREACQDNT